MKLSFLGAAREVTGSQHLLEANGKRILLDCGMFQGNRKESHDKNQEQLVDVSTIDMVILSHAHIDHSGNLPYIVKLGYNNPIICTEPTIDLCQFMLMDSAYIQEREVDFMKRHKMDTPIEPLYTSKDAEAALQLFKGIKYHTKTKLFEGIYLTFIHAGHILGAAQVVLEIHDKEDNNKIKTVTFTGDLGRKESALLYDPEYITETNILIMESTYGNRFHKWLRDVDDKLAELINETAAKGGKIIIPAFALERTQEVVYHLNLLQKMGRIPKLPVFVDSPLAVNVTDVFKKHTDCYNKATQEEFIKNADNPFGFNQLTYIHDVEDSKALNEKQGPMVIISASGMCEFGRILHHLRNNIEDRRNLILIVGYQAQGTLGRRLVDKEKSVRIFGERKRVKAKVAVLDAFSGHADRSDLIDYTTHIQKVENIFLVHGEEEQGLTFAQILKEIKPKTNVFVPSRGESFKI